MITFLFFGILIQNWKLQKKSVITEKKMLSPDPTFFVVWWNHVVGSNKKNERGKNFPEKQIPGNSFVSILSSWQSYNRLIWNILCEIVSMQKNAKSRVYSANFVRCVLDFLDVVLQFFWKRGIYLRKLNMIAGNHGRGMVQSASTYIIL